MASDDSAEKYRSFWGAKIFWPPDIPDDMLEFAVKTAHRANEDFNIEEQGTEVCEFIKKSFDETFKPHWHVFVGKNFGCYSVHESRRFVYFTIGQYSYMIFKAG
mmetsp:Transcript_57571/g.65686  ORF Transcript_57571/g.65686 Transcript_57571/m.65686 type:complete len:104 (+) Transcript_57571:74-385(+)